MRIPDNTSCGNNEKKDDKGVNFMQWIAGIDGGGTKTAFSLMEKNNGRILHKILPSLSPKEHGIDEFRCIMSRAFLELGVDRESVTAVFAGIPCFGEDKRLDSLILQQMEELFPNAEIRCENDCFVGFAAAFGMGPGINIVSGTGAISYGMDSAGNCARSNGWHPCFSDEGSGTWLGRACFSLFAKQSDGRAEKGALYDIFRSHLNISEDFDAIAYYEAFCLENRANLAKMQEILLQAARAGDCSAQKLYEDAARELADTVYAVYKRLSFEDTVFISYSGGVFRSGKILLQPFTRMLENRISDCRIVPPKYTPEDGALIAAARLIGYPAEKYIEKE